MELPEPKQEGLNPKDFVGTVFKCRISFSDIWKDCVLKEDLKSKNDREYSKYHLRILKDGQHTTLAYLWDNQLSEVMKTYGIKTELWTNMPIEVTALEQGKYFIWVIKPCEEFDIDVKV